MGEEFEGRTDTCIYMAKSLCCSLSLFFAEIITTLLVGYAAAAKSLQSCPTLCDPTPIQNKLKKIKKNFFKDSTWA